MRLNSTKQISNVRVGQFYQSIWIAILRAKLTARSVISTVYSQIAYLIKWLRIHHYPKSLKLV